MSKYEPCLEEAKAFEKLKRERPGEPVAPKRRASDFDDALTELAKRNQQAGESLAKAYTRVLDTEEGGLLYQAHRSAMRAEQLGMSAARRVT